MKSTHVVALRVPGEMKRCLERVAEMGLERRIARTPLELLKKKAHAVLDRVPTGPVPDWDELP